MVSCMATTKKGPRCRIKAASGQDYCGRYPSHYPKCKGVKIDGTQCRAFVKRFGDEYCRPQHVPGVQVLRTKFFRDDTVRARYLSKFGGKIFDRYESKAIRRTGELDHVVELHIVRDAAKWVKRHQLAAWVKPVVNMDENLNFTSQSNNRLKFEANKEFAHDYAMGNGVGSLAHYLRLQGGLSRNVTRRIGSETKKSFDFILDTLEPNSFIEHIVVDYLHDRMVAMDLE
ncbi:hypothetical protein BC829DRAFT_157396 [Chytridium lagenaria]|nr:hypothetical protein BC829DRAFT_157396 [Chytridium lagenaria]